MKLQKVNECNQTLTYSLGLCASFSTIKFLKLLRFNRNIEMVGETLKLCFNELISFSLVFFLIWIAFVQLMYLIFDSTIVGYSSFVKSMATAFAMMLGKLDGEQIIQAQFILGPMIMASFYSMVIIFALNVFISIIVDAFEVVRIRTHNKSNDFDVLGYVWRILGKIFRGKAVKGKKTFISPNMYKDHISLFTCRVQMLLELYKKVR